MVRVKHIFIVLLMLVGCRASAEKEWHDEMRLMYWDLPVQIQYYPANDELSTNVWRYLEQINDVFNDYKAGSEIHTLNRMNSTNRVELSPILAEAFEKANEAYKLSGGVFDITCAPIRNIWKDAAKSGKVPTAENVASVRARCGMDKVELSGRKLQMTRTGMEFDFGGIIKGVIVDHAIDLLKQGGASSALVHVGGETAVYGVSKRMRPYRIAIEHPTRHWQDWCGLRASRRGLSASSSGNDAQPIKINGKEFYHIMDPRTGKPVETQILSVTIVFPRPGMNWLTDTLSTTGVLLGPEKTFAIVKRYGGEAMFLMRENGEIKELTTPGWSTLK